MNEHRDMLEEWNEDAAFIWKNRSTTLTLLTGSALVVERFTVDGMEAVAIATYDAAHRCRALQVLDDRGTHDLKAWR